MFESHTLENFDPVLWTAVQHEQQRQEDHIELIASENYVSPEVLALQGSVLTNKYAEGYPGKRYYGGCQFVDQIEQLAIDRAQQLFGADYANVQPHSGSQANAAAFMALIQPGDTFLAMDLTHGGHLTHGSPVNFSGKLYHPIHYGLDAHGQLDYTQIESLAVQHQPKLLVAGFSAYSGLVDWKRMREIADRVGAYFMVDMAHVAGLVAVGLYPNPVPFADVVTSTTHKTLRGPRSGLILARKNPEIEKKLNAAIFPGLQGGPLVHVIAAKALAFLEAMQPAFKTYQQQVLNNAKKMVSVLQQKGFTIVSNGTENHMFLINLTNKKLTGQAAEIALDEAYITVNKNTIPHDPLSPSITSGIRIGTPAVTTRGFKESEMELLADWIYLTLEESHNHGLIGAIREEVMILCERFPVYQQQ